MVNPTQKSNGALSSQENDQGQENPAVHTMQSDLDELRRVTDPSILKRIQEETARRTRPKISVGTILSWPLKTYLWMGAGAATIALLAGGWYFLMPIFLEAPPETSTPKLTPPSQLFTSETSRTISADSRDAQKFLFLMEDSYREIEGEGTVKRILVKLQDGPQERFINTADFFEFYRLTPPKNLLETSDKEIMPFFYYGQDGARFGMAWKVKEHDRAFANMLIWEPSLLTNWGPFFFGEEHDILLSSVFEDRVYRNIDWRFLKLSQEKDLGIAYMVFPAKNILVITTSKASMETVINRLFDAR